ncbi:EamA family transporter RarD [Sphaerotilus sp.]|uniref:EamA family transporter RarD n=1 Tax=Sphaerotilus sp. TaxID=2093942 RepID=UPI0025D626C6|nr:EamA family transporter RarD [Sphaerotilus sp.]
MRGGIVQASLAYVIWGLFPLYFRLLHGVVALEVLAHRVVWSLVFLLGVLTVRRQWAWLGPALRNRRVLGLFLASSVLIATNWYVYIWAIGHGRVVDASLGYFITPLVNVLTGALVLKERLRPVQWLAVATAALGVAWLTWAQGTPPWIALVLAASFSTYGLLRKTATLGALEGLTLETLLLGPVALAGLGWAITQGQATFPGATLDLQGLLLLTGPLTAVPLLLFAGGARRIPLSLLGMLQYIGPTIQLALGVWLFHEPFAGARAQGFAIIWAACALFSAELWWRSRRTP